MSPEVINEEEQGFGVDTWALGNILFKMLYGKVPFVGSNPEKVYMDIKQRNIHWPPAGEIESIMSQDAQEVINLMI